MAASSGEELWLKIFRNNEDLHGILAMETFNITKEQLKSQVPFLSQGTTFRDMQKTIDFLIPYGGGAPKLAETFKLPLARAENIIRSFFKSSPRVEKYLLDNAKFAVENGYSRTLAPIGRIRWYKAHASLHKLDEFKRKQVIGDIERQGMNSPVQGSSADLVKIAMVMTRDYIRDNNLWDKVKMCLQVHDELVDEVTTDYAEEYQQIKSNLMLKAGEVIIKQIPMSSTSTLADTWSK